MTPANAYVSPRTRLTRMLQAQFDAAWAAYLRPCIPRLVDLIEDTQGLRPADAEANVRRIIAECCRPYDTNAGSRPQDPAVLDEHVKLIARRLERLRRVSFDTGTWSELPVTPLMCG